MTENYISTIFTDWKAETSGLLWMEYKSKKSVWYYKGKSQIMNYPWISFLDVTDCMFRMVKEPFKFIMFWETWTLVSPACTLTPVKLCKREGLNEAPSVLCAVTQHPFQAWLWQIGRLWTLKDNELVWIIMLYSV